MKTILLLEDDYITKPFSVNILTSKVNAMMRRLHKIFRRCYRGTRVKERAKDGAGVGLYLARNIIEQQGGTILAKRKPEKGSIFNIIIPLD